MLTGGILQYPGDSSQATVIINNNPYPILTYAEPKLNEINLRECFSFLLLISIYSFKSYRPAAEWA